MRLSFIKWLQTLKLIYYVSQAHEQTNIEKVNILNNNNKVPISSFEELGTREVFANLSVAQPR